MIPAQLGGRISQHTGKRFIALTECETLALDADTRLLAAKIFSKLAQKKYVK